MFVLSPNYSLSRGMCVWLTTCFAAVCLTLKCFRFPPNCPTHNRAQRLIIYLEIIFIARPIITLWSIWCFKILNVLVSKINIGGAVVAVYLKWSTQIVDNMDIDGNLYKMYLLHR